MTEHSPCCDLHLDGPSGACCDPDDCGPCCGRCPTCPMLHNARTPGPRRLKTERGEVGIIGSVILVLLALAAIQLVFDVDPVQWVGAAVDWIVDLIRGLGGESPLPSSTRH